MTYGEKLIQLRKNANMTQADLGEKLGVTAQAVSKWEHDVSEPDLGTLRKISSIFGVSVDDFLDAEKEVVPVVPVNPAEVAQEMAPVVAAGVREDIVAGVREGINDSTDAIKTTVKEVGDAVLGLRLYWADPIARGLPLRPSPPPRLVLFVISFCLHDRRSVCR